MEEKIAQRVTIQCKKKKTKLYVELENRRIIVVMNGLFLVFTGKGCRFIIPLLSINRGKRNAKCCYQDRI